MDPTRPFQGLGFMTSSQAPMSAALFYPIAGVGQVIQAENYEGPFLLPFSSSSSNSSSLPSPDSVFTTAKETALPSLPPFYRPETRSPRAAWDSI